MDKQHVVKLTLGLYGLTKSLPEEEPLRCALRSKAVDILADAAALFSSNPLPLTYDDKKIIRLNVLKNIKAQQALLEVAEEQGWQRADYFELLKKEYNVLAEASQMSINRVAEAISENELPVMYLLGERYIEALKKLSDSQNSKMVVLPSDLSASLRGLVSAIKK